MKPGYDGETLLSVGFFTKEQRQRLEAYTAARKLEPHEDVTGRMRVARYIVAGTS